MSESLETDPLVAPPRGNESSADSPEAPSGAHQEAKKIGRGSLDRSRTRFAAETYRLLNGFTAKKDKSKSQCTTKEVQMWSLLVCSILGILVLFIIIAYLTLSAQRAKIHTCQTPECLSAAAGIISKMDLTNDPCDDFYQYSCAGFYNDPLMETHTRGGSYGTLTELHDSNLALLKLDLESPGALLKGVNSTAIQKARSYYKACMDRSGDVRDRTILQMKQVIRNLGSWPLLNDSAAGLWRKSKWTLEHTLSQAFWYGKSPLFTLRIEEDDKNNTIQKITLDQSGQTLSPDEYKLNNTPSIQERYARDIMSVAESLGNTNDITNLVKDAWQLEVALMKALDTPEERSDPTSLYHLMTLKDVQRLMGKSINMTTYLWETLGSIIHLDEEVVVRSPRFLKKLAVLIETADPRTLATYTVWQVVRSLVPYALPTVTRDREQDIEGSWRECVHRTDSRMIYATGALFVESINFQEQQKRGVHYMFRVQNQFIKTLASFPLTHHSTREKAVQKVVKTKGLVGYPDFVLHPKRLDKYYEKVNISEDDSFRNELNFRFFDAINELQKLGSPSNANVWSISILDVRARYIRSKNTLLLPAGLLQEPVLYTNLPISLLFSPLGTIIGHELTHAIDLKGQQYDEFGNLNNWSTDKSTELFIEKTQCLQNQYSQYTVDGQHLNGRLTLGENLADNIGLQIAYSTFKRWTPRRVQREVFLPGLNFTAQQLFFLSLAQTQCYIIDSNYARQHLQTERQSYPKFRVIGMLTNSEEFAKAFECPSGTIMNPKHKCEVL